MAALDRKGKPVSWEGALTKLGTGVAFLAISIVLGVTNMAGGRVWWFWMLIPAFTMIAAGIAQYIQLRNAERDRRTGFAQLDHPDILTPPNNASLPQPQTAWVSPESRYKTGDLVPPSVTENTTRHLEVDKEGQTMSLPRK